MGDISKRYTPKFSLLLKMRRVARYLLIFSNEGRSAAAAGLATKFIANGRETTLYMGG